MLHLAGALNVFRLLGDMFHLLSFQLLFQKMNNNKSVEGLSRKSQELYMAVFCTRYLDLFLIHRYSWNVLTMYNTAMKVFFIGSSMLIVHRFQLIPWKATYNDKEDSFRHWLFIALPCFLIACLLHMWDGPMELLYSFSIMTEAFAILPQLVMLHRHKNVENLTGNFVFALGLYRAFYIVNWIYRYLADNHTTERIV
jgi:ER lumen protein retaining receptor